MSDHAPTLIMFGSLVVVCATIVTLTILGVKLDSPTIAELSGGIGTIIGAIAGYSMPRPKQ